MDNYNFIKFDFVINFLEIMKLHADSIEKSYGNKKLLSDICISCETNEIVGILGRNGCGKSTLLKIIFGITSAENKFVKVGNKIINNNYGSKNLIRYLPQNHFLPNHLKIKTIIETFCNKQNAEIVKTSNLIEHFINERPKNLSGGEKRLVEILVLLYSDCQFLLLDEPFYFLSPKITEMVKLIIKQQSINKGIIVTDHQYQNVLEICDRVLLLKNGTVKTINSIEDLSRYGYLESL